MNPNQHSEQPLFATNQGETLLPPDNVVFDEETFLDYVGNNLALAQRVARRFLADSPGRLAEIGTALCAGNAPMLARTAHTLKGAVSFFAAAAAVDAAREVETIARTGDLQGVANAGATLQREIVRLTAALEAFLA